MRSLIVILLLTYLSTCHGTECQENEYVNDGCYPKPHICQIECIKDTQCTEEGPSCDEALVTEEVLPTLTAMDAAQCSLTCSLSKDVQDITQRCRFWRWGVVGKNITCILMSDEQCTAFEDCSGEHCSCGDNGCVGGADPAPTMKPCVGPIVYERDHIHWTCYDEGGHIGAYAGESLEDGAICITAQKCADWALQSGDVDLSKTLKVKCNNGKWEADDGGDEVAYTTVLPGEGMEAIKEPPCNGGGNKLRLDVTKMDQTGANLICESPYIKGDGTEAGDPEDVYVIEAPNSCILLCDNQLGWTLESVLNLEGTRRFQCDATACVGGEFPAIATEQGQEENTQDGSMVECWPARKH